MSELVPPRSGDAAEAPIPAFSKRLYAASVLTPQAPIADWLSDLAATIKERESPFARDAVVLDLSHVRLSSHAIVHLVTTLEDRGVRVLGIEGIEEAAPHKGLPPVLCRHDERTSQCTEPAPSSDASSPQTPAPKSLLIDDFVRSGQRVSFMEGDVTVVGSVGSGAEIVAGGSIHVYGTLRGRAMAGAGGNTRARIFCQSLEAELLAIGSQFKTLDDIGADLRHGPVQVWLDGAALNVALIRQDRHGA